MPADVQTLYLMNFVLAFVIAGISYYSWFHQRDMVGMRGWSLGLFLGAVGSLELSLRSIASPPVLVLSANTLVIAGYATIWTSLRRFNTGHLELYRFVAPTVAFASLFGAALLAGVSLNTRVAISSAAIAALTALSGWEVLRARATEPLTSRLPTAAALGVIAGAMTVRLVFSLGSDGPVGEEPFFDPTQGSTLFVNTVCIVAMTMGFLLMANERLRHHYETLARTDELTGLPNRRFFLEQGERLAGRSLAEGSSAWVMMIDLDDFSQVNMMFGHAGGDRALAAFAASARQSLRQGDLIARYGGEEFCALLPDASETEALRLAEALRAGLAGLAINLDGRQLRITASIGVAPLEQSLRLAMGRADAALYRAKELGRNRVCALGSDATVSAGVGA